MKVCRVVTVPFFFQNHLREQLLATVRAGHELTLVCSDGPEIEDLQRIEGAVVHRIEIPRTIWLWRDFLALCRLTMFFLKHRFDVVHSATPKAGMLSALAGWLTRVPVRLHTFTGQPWMERKGLVRFLAKQGDQLTATLTTRCYADSASQREFLIAQGVAAAHRIHTLGSGSIAGVDLQRFAPDRWLDAGEATRQELGVISGTRIVTFIGRLTEDKGIHELLTAAKVLKARDVPVVFLLIGPKEPDTDKLLAEFTAMDASSVRFLGYRPDPERYLAISDLLCLPSYREGFPIVVIEAAAMGIPTIGTDIIGMRDSLVAGETGVLVPPKDAMALANALTALLNDIPRCRAMGVAGRLRVVREFDASVVNGRVIAEYEELLGQARPNGVSA